MRYFWKAREFEPWLANLWQSCLGESGTSRNCKILGLKKYIGQTIAYKGTRSDFDSCISQKASPISILKQPKYHSTLLEPSHGHPLQHLFSI